MANKKQPDKEYSPNWGGARTNLKGRVGRKATGRKTIFASVTISGYPEEVEKIKALAKESGKSVSRFIIEKILNE